VTEPTGFTQPTPNDMCLPYQSRVDRFYYYINPVITRVQPHSGPVEGNTRITIEGSGFYPELLSISSCYHGVTTFQSAQRIGFLPLANVTDYATTVTKVVCPLTNPAAVGLNEMFFSMNSQQPAINRPIPGYKDRRSNRFAHRLSSDVIFFNLPAFYLTPLTTFVVSPCFQPDFSSIPLLVWTASCLLARHLTILRTGPSQCNTLFILSPTSFP
jgi:hypothetical protein